MMATEYVYTTSNGFVALWLALWILAGLVAVFWTVISLLWTAFVELWRAHRRGMARLHHYTERVAP